MRRLLVASATLLPLAIACAGATAGPVERPTIVVPPQPPQPVAPASNAAPSPAAPVPVATPSFRCESGKRFEVGQRSYCAYTDPQAWEASEARCGANGGHLMTLESKATSDALHAALGSPIPGANRAAWIGLELKTRGGKDWKWITGDALTAASWNTGEPNNFDKNEQCAEWLVVDGRWNDTRCELRQPYLCQSKSGKPVTCTRGRAFAVGDVSYCLNGANRTWAEAKRACTSDGGSLAVLKTADENATVRQAMAARFNAKRMWIGLTDATEEGNWIWTSGTPMDFEAWQAGEPNDFNQENCAELHGDTWSWNDLDCSVPLPSVCESPPKQR